MRKRMRFAAVFAAAALLAMIALPFAEEIGRASCRERV